MTPHKNHKDFTIPETLLFRKAWQQFDADVKRNDLDADVHRLPLFNSWRRHSWLLKATWRGLMESLLRPTTWRLLQRLLERREMNRQVWMRDGSWLFTKKGTRRKRWTKNQRKPNPRILRREISDAQDAYDDALTLEGETFATNVEALILALAGNIYTCSHQKSRREAQEWRVSRLRFPRLHWTPWDRSFKSRAKSMMWLGILQQPDSRKLK